MSPVECGEDPCRTPYQHSYLAYLHRQTISWPEAFGGQADKVIGWCNVVNLRPSPLGHPFLCPFQSFRLPHCRFDADTCQASAQGSSKQLGSGLCSVVSHSSVLRILRVTRRLAAWADGSWRVSARATSMLFVFGHAQGGSPGPWSHPTPTPVPFELSASAASRVHGSGWICFFFGLRVVVVAQVGQQLSHQPRTRGRNPIEEPPCHPIALPVWWTPLLSFVPQSTPHLLACLGRCHILG